MCNLHLCLLQAPVPTRLLLYVCKYHNKLLLSDSLALLMMMICSKVHIPDTVNNIKELQSINLVKLAEICLGSTYFYFVGKY